MDFSQKGNSMQSLANTAIYARMLFFLLPCADSHGLLIWLSIEKNGEIPYIAAEPITN